jgi:hypothetical protein
MVSNWVRQTGQVTKGAVASQLMMMTMNNNLATYMIHQDVIQLAVFEKDVMRERCDKMSRKGRVWEIEILWMLDTRRLIICMPKC